MQQQRFEINFYYYRRSGRISLVRVGVSYFIIGRGRGIFRKCMNMLADPGDSSFGTFQGFSAFMRG